MNNDSRKAEKDAKGIALSAKRNPDNDLTADSRRFTQMDTERNPFKKITAGAPIDGLRVVSQVEPQRA